MSEKTFVWVLWLSMWPAWFLSFGTRAMWPVLGLFLIVHFRLNAVTDPIRRHC